MIIARFRARCRTALAALALLLSGCASMPPAEWRGASSDDRSCLVALAAHDAEVDRAGLRDAEAERIAGFPFLRIDRLTAALAPRAVASDAAFDVWLQRLRALDATARDVEGLAAGAAPPACADRLVVSLRADPEARALLLTRARVPDRYSKSLRVVGWYALTRIPFFAGVQAWQREQQEQIREAAARARPALRIGDVQAAVPLPPAHARPRDALGLPLVDAAAAEGLLAAHAPIFDIEAQREYDRIGAPGWRAAGQLAVDTGETVVYQRLTHTLVQGHALVQLVYTAWFAERPKRGAFDLLGGAIDGLIVRITLAPDGRPLLVDTIHACGCFHLFFPAAGVTLRPGAPVDKEWAFVPAALPRWQAGDRFAIRVASATHDVIGLSTVPSTQPDLTARYQRRPESQLKRLPTPDGGVRSLYGPDGLVAGSERAERFFFWPMGIASAGTMRQWGHHATAFVGRRHFDDADLIERRFAIPALE
ncbi:MAG: hypothetical protein ABIQ29_08770 [Burkholderiaceae bacterium]